MHSNSISWKNFFCPKNWGNGLKIGFFEFKECCMLIWAIWSLDSKIESTNGINLFFAYWYSFMKINLKVLGGWDVQKWVWPVMLWDFKIGCIWEWTDGINWFFSCWYRFTKIKSWSKNFWEDIVKNGCGQSGHGTLKLAVSSILVFCMLVQIQEG